MVKRFFSCIELVSRRVAMNRNHDKGLSSIRPGYPRDENATYRTGDRYLLQREAVRVNADAFRVHKSRNRFPQDVGGLCVGFVRSQIVCGLPALLQ